MMAKEILQRNKSLDLSDLKDSHLSIQLSLDGFSFCIINKETNQITAINHYPFPNNSPSPQKHLENVIQVFKKDELLHKKFGSVNISHINDLSTLVPKPLFDEAQLKNYLKFSSKIYENDYIVYDHLDNYDLVNVFIPFVNINNFLLDKYGSFEYKHSSAILVENLLRTYKFSEHPHMFANINEHHFEIVIIANNKLLLYNTHRYTTKEDFIYFVLFTAEQLQLNTEKFELVFSGIIDKESELYKIAYTYIRNVSLLENRSKYSFSPEFTEGVKRRFFTLLNQY